MKSVKGGHLLRNTKWGSSNVGNHEVIANIGIISKRQAQQQGNVDYQERENAVTSHNL